MQAEIEQRELELSHGVHGGLKRARRQKPIQQRLRQWIARFDVTRDESKRLFLPAPVLEKLARQLHRVPLDAIDTGDRGYRLCRQHVVQAMSEFVEQGCQLIVRQQAG